MHKVMLVDDEMFVREGMKTLIDWERCGYRICGEAHNGEQALREAAKLCPDLIVTDIRMPGIDGLELIQRVSRSGQTGTKFIVVSGYNDFFYAQQSIKYGVCDFLLKPIDKREFEQSLLRIAEVLNQEKETRKKQQAEFLFYEWVTGKKGTSLMEMGDWGVSSSILSGYAIIEINGKADMVHLAADAAYKTKIKEIYHRVVKQPIHFPIYEHGRQRYGLLFIGDGKEEIRHNLYRFAEQLVNVPLDVTIFVSALASPVDRLQERIREAGEALRYKYANDDRIIFYEQVKEITLSYPSVDDGQIQTLVEYIEEARLEQLMTAMKDLFAQFRARRLPAEAVQTFILYFVQKALQLVKRAGACEEQLTTLPRVLECQDYPFRLEELRKRVMDFAVECCWVVEEQRKPLSLCEIHKIKRYIEEHYAENISLKSIAKQFYMNPVYLGQLFKKTYGFYFKEFLLQLRIGQAKKLLRTTNLRIYEVAEKVGFGSVDYFVTQFEKMEGLTPSEYRKKSTRSVL
ncbi:response regulator transcription factor [Geobacillus sp. C56-T3]|uniref:response regulator transcription factor n=1 Tax=Geobacillus sp. (strain C56-T3) TaxID=691437 RepID=UPI0001D5835D|nr:response regulator transcription factor [Geobacillus sp. C56-T3]ADI26660.1 two component transcriptional regulator, AraC family [Geobacillus sp. C56-T3]